MALSEMERFESSVPGARILVVEDEAIIAHDLKRRLERLNYEVVGIADTGAEAIAMTQETQPTLVFMDIRIQGPRDGVDTAGELSERWDVPVVFLTAHSDAATLARAKRVRPYGYLIKPFEEHDLVTTLELALYRHQSEAQARLLLHAMSGATIGIAIADARDPKQRFTLCNAEFERLTGYSRAEILQHNPCFLEGPDTSPLTAAEVRRALTEGREIRRELLVYRKDGTSFWSELLVSVVRDSVGEVTHFLVFHSDISTRKGTEKKLLHAQKMEAISRLTGGVAHDFNNILNVIISFASLAHDDLPEHHAGREDLTEVLRAANKAAGLTRQLLTFSRQQPVVERPIDLNDSTEKILGMLRRSVGERVLVEFVPSARPAIVRMDPVQFDQVLLNLAVNARDAVGEAGRFRIALSHPAETVGVFPAGRCVRLVASDTGKGMDAATAERVFEPFFTTKPVGEGTGLGLATCFAIVDAAGGTISVDSTPMQGTSIIIDWPTCDEPIDELVESLPTTRLATGEHVLVVEDDDALRRVAVRILESAGYVVSQARDGDDAIARLDEAGRSFDLIFSDVVMPGAGGQAVADHARQVDPGAAVLLSSGYFDVQTGDRGALTDELPLLWKPYTPARLLHAVRRALTGRPRPEGSPAPSVDGQNTVLLIEDDAIVRRLLQRVLASKGYEVTVADSLASGRAALSPDRDYAAVLCDLSLPDGSGAHLVEWIRGARPMLWHRTVIVTGGAVDDAGRELLKRGDVEVLHKPLTPSGLLERVAAVVARGRAREHSTTVQPVAPARPSTLPPPAATAGAILLVESDDAERVSYERALRSSGFTVTCASSNGDARVLLESLPFDAVVTDSALPPMTRQPGLGHLPEPPTLIVIAAPSAEAAMLVAESRAGGYLAKPFEAARLVEELERAVEARLAAQAHRRLAARDRRGGLPELRETRRRFNEALGGLVPLFQPIVRSADGSIYGYVAEPRSDEPTLGSAPALRAAAEALGRSEELGLAVRGAVARTLAEHPEHSEAIFVHVHPSELRGDLLCAATEPLRRGAGRVVLEVADRASLAVGPQLAGEIRALQAEGYRVALDGLGGGYADLSWLAHLTLDLAKIDVSLVRDVHDSKLKQEIVRSLVQLCRRQGVAVLAAGVQSYEEARALTDLGCDLLQGDFLCEAAPAFPASHWRPDAEDWAR